MVFAESDFADPATVNDPCVYSRDVTISVNGMLKLPGTGDTYTIEDRMDECAAEIESKLTQSALRTELSQVHTLALTSTSMEVILEDDGIDHAEVILQWRIGYSTLEGFPATLL